MATRATGKLEQGASPQPPAEVQEQGGGEAMAWQHPDTLPPVEPGQYGWFWVAVRRANSGHVYSFPATYLNAMVLTDENCDQEESQGNRYHHGPADEDDGEFEATGWHDAKEHSEYSAIYLPLLDSDNDELIAWRAVADYGDTAPPSAPEAQPEDWPYPPCELGTPASGDGFQRAFYEIVEMLGIPCPQPLSPKQVWEGQMRPKLRSMIGRPPAEAQPCDNQECRDQLADLLLTDPESGEPCCVVSTLRRGPGGFQSFDIQSGPDAATWRIEFRVSEIGGQDANPAIHASPISSPTSVDAARQVGPLSSGTPPSAPVGVEGQFPPAAFEQWFAAIEAGDGTIPVPQSAADGDAWHEHIGRRQIALGAWIAATEALAQQPASDEQCRRHDCRRVRAEMQAEIDRLKQPAAVDGVDWRNLLRIERAIRFMDEGLSKADAYRAAETDCERVEALAAQQGGEE